MAEDKKAKEAREARERQLAKRADKLGKLPDEVAEADRMMNDPSSSGS